MHNLCRGMCVGTIQKCSYGHNVHRTIADINSPTSTYCFTVVHSDFTYYSSFPHCDYSWFQCCVVVCRIFDSETLRSLGRDLGETWYSNLQCLSSLVIGLLRTDSWQKSDQYLGQTAMNGWVPRYEFLLTKTDNSRLGVCTFQKPYVRRYVA